MRNVSNKCRRAEAVLDRDGKKKNSFNKVKVIKNNKERRKILKEAALEGV